VRNANVRSKIGATGDHLTRPVVKFSSNLVDSRRFDDDSAPSIDLSTTPGRRIQETLDAVEHP